jgi:ppGpp synthetase/RelA/SpoT-type nucleotidyltranferase
MDNEVEKILKDYRRMKPLYKKFTDFVVSKLEIILKDSSLFKYRIVYSQKTEESLKEKIEVEKKGVRKLDEINDLSRAKIILYFKEDVEIVRQKIHKNFNVLKEEFKPFFRDIDGLGNNAFKLVVKLKKENSEEILRKENSEKEFQKFEELKFEIQITTELYNVLTELEYILTYKPEKNIKERYKEEWGILKKEFIDIMESYIEPSQIKFNQIIKKFKGLLEDKSFLEK